MTLESILNFNVGATVIFNPDNHGFKNLGAYDKVKDRKGKVRFMQKIVKNNILLPSGFEYKPTGKISVLWDGVPETRVFDYKRLKIITP